MRTFAAWVKAQRAAPLIGRASVQHMDDGFVRDASFLGLVRRLRDARRFLIEEGVAFRSDDESALDVTELYRLQFNSSGGEVTRDQWMALERTERTLAGYFTPDLRQKLRLIEARLAIGRWPIWFLLLALCSFVVAVIAPARLLSEEHATLASFVSLFAYLIWTVSLGGLGAAAFLAVNSLGIQSDTSFDIGDRSLIFMRLVVGSLFGFVLSLPVSLPAFTRFAQEAIGAAGEQTEASLQTVALILLPFFLGFSTPLVLAVMNRCVSAVEILFGVRQMAPADRTSQPRREARRDRPAGGQNAGRPSSPDPSP